MKFCFKKFAYIVSVIISFVQCKMQRTSVSIVGFHGNVSVWLSPFHEAAAVEVIQVSPLVPTSPAVDIPVSLENKSEWCLGVLTLCDSGGVMTLRKN